MYPSNCKQKETLPLLSSSFVQCLVSPTRKVIDTMFPIFYLMSTPGLHCIWILCCREWILLRMVLLRSSQGLVRFLHSANCSLVLDTSSLHPSAQKGFSSWFFSASLFVLHFCDLVEGRCEPLKPLKSRTEQKERVPALSLEHLLRRQQKSHSRRAKSGWKKQPYRQQPNLH